MKITRRQAEYFSVAAELLHFGKAAESLYVSQAVVSQEIRRLEEGLGFRLFDRSTRRVALTRAGDDLLPFVKRFLEAGKALDAIANRLGADAETPVRLGASPSAMDHFVPALLRAVEELSGITVEEFPVDTGQLSTAIEAGKCDLGIGRFPKVGDGYQVSTLYDEPMVVALSTRHPLAQQARIDLSQLSDLPLLVWPREQDPAYYDALLDLCRERGLDPLVMTGRALVLGPRSYLIAENRVFALLPIATTLRLEEGLVARPLTVPATLPMSMVTHKDEPRAAVLKVAAAARKLASMQQFTS
ncbi:LysR family transcriptional regulator [Diaminobutyricibacter sp. McL0608]|uniref:LysR substrate-binding domain-containing protein n=1 Tax=Leifsonia sp. McL0608 TaxID=3143537 RepID=UPI0031F2F5EB